MFPKLPDVESSTDGFLNLWSISMASVVGSLIIHLSFMHVDDCYWAVLI